MTLTAKVPTYKHSYWVHQFADGSSERVRAVAIGLYAGVFRWFKQLGRGADQRLAIGGEDLDEHPTSVRNGCRWEWPAQQQVVERPIERGRKRPA